MLARLRPHLLSSANFSQFQLACGKGHSTETALLEVVDGVFTAADDKQVTVLIGQDLRCTLHALYHRYEYLPNSWCSWFIIHAWRGLSHRGTDRVDRLSEDHRKAPVLVQSRYKTVVLK